MNRVPHPININVYKNLPVSHVSSYEDNELLEIESGGFVSNCVLKHAKETIRFYITSTAFKWELTDIKVKFKRYEIDESCLEVDNPTGEFDAEEQAMIMINIKNTSLDFFADTNDRIFTVSIEYIKDAEHECTSEFLITLPIIPKQSEWPVKLRLRAAVVPDKATRVICQQHFQMTPNNKPIEIQKCALLTEFQHTEAKERLRTFGYVSMLKLLLIIEDSFITDIVESRNLYNHYIQRMSVMHYKIKLYNKIPPLAEAVCLTPMDQIGQPDCKSHQIQCKIVRYGYDHLVIEMKRSKVKEISSDFPYHVRFIPNLYSNKMSHLALRAIKEKGLQKWMLDFDGVHRAPSVHVKIHEEFDWFNPNVSTNDEQKLAIKNIVNKTSKAMPFVIFGPPGTGKTTTIVEAVAQIVTLNPDARILISVNSNSACDEIGERLIKYISKNKVYRFYAPSFERKLDKVHPKLKSISNLRNDYNNFPSYQELYSYNVVITTLVNSGRLLAAQVNPKHFDYVFIDECASTAECYVIIPIAVCAQFEKITATIVLCGDHKQLGPVFNTHYINIFGFSVSLMERVLFLDEYKRNPNYNTDYVIKLVKNFRSHHAILEFSNDQFYKGELQACQSPEIANFAIGWELLPNKSFPILFHSIFSPSAQEGTSCYNMKEIYETRDYVEHLLLNGINGKTVKPHDIGIVCPYNAQRERLQLLFGHTIEVGTVDYYQGREKKIIIFSAVRSRTRTIGFLCNEKRLNVALTRAKSLLIVLGNPETLYQNIHWREFIRYCRDNKAVVGWVPENHLVRSVEELEIEEFYDADDQDIYLEEIMDDLAIEE